MHTYVHMYTCIYPHLNVHAHVVVMRNWLLSYIHIFMYMFASYIYVCRFVCSVGSAGPAMFLSSYDDARVWRQTHVLHHDLIPLFLHACWVGLGPTSRLLGKALGRFAAQGA